MKTVNCDDFNPEELRALLPPIYREYTRRIPVGALIKLSEAKGGIEIMIPKRVDADCWLAHIMGLNAAQTMSSIYGGENVKVPRAAQLVRAVRDRNICTLRARDGLSLTKLALKFQLSDRAISQIWARGKARALAALGRRTGHQRKATKS